MRLRRRLETPEVAVAGRQRARLLTRLEHGTIWIAEVKSLARTTESQQLRLGLGQLLDYRQAIATPEIPIRAALVIEQQPSDLRWVVVCAAVEVVLAWPERFAAVFLGIGSPGSDPEH